MKTTLSLQDIQNRWPARFRPQASRNSPLHRAFAFSHLSTGKKGVAFHCVTLFSIRYFFSGRSKINPLGFTLLTVSILLFILFTFLFCNTCSAQYWIRSIQITHAFFWASFPSSLLLLDFLTAKQKNKEGGIYFEIRLLGQKEWNNGSFLTMWA